MSALDRYFAMVLGLPVVGPGGAVRTRLRREAQPPFLLPYAVMELRRGGEAYRSLAPDMPEGAEATPFEALDGRVETALVLTPGPDWQPQRENAARPLDPALPITGASRLPKGGYGFGIVVDGRFVSWACASPVGPVWNVTVETDRAFRGKGFAAAGARALTGDILRRGRTPLYLCDADNEASRKTALAAGYSMYGQWLRLAQGPGVHS